MELFTPLVNQMMILFVFVAIGFLLSRTRLMPESSVFVLSKLESLVFVPALAMGTFIKYCRVELLGSMWRIFVLGAGTMLLCLLLALPMARLCFKKEYLRKIATYGLGFANYGFMGNAIIIGVFGEESFFAYSIFTLPFTFALYLWAIPVLLISNSREDGERVPLRARMKSFFNPMMLGMVIGLILGLSGLSVPTPLMSVIELAGSFMSPLGMLLTGMAVGRLSLSLLFKRPILYVVSAIKLILYPLVFFGVFLLLPRGGFFTDGFFAFAMCVAAMPVGLNTIVIPAAYGKDITDASGLVLVSHLFSLVTVPLAFLLLQAVIL